MKDKIFKNIETVINSTMTVEEKIKILLDTQDYIRKNLNFLEKKTKESRLDNYLKKYGNNQSDDSYTLERRCEMDRDLQEIFISMLSEINIDGHDSFTGEIPKQIKEEYKETFNIRGFENDTFYIRPYNWDGISLYDCSCGLDDKLDELEEPDIAEYEHGFHSKDCVAWETNFYYKPANLKIAWYKYPLRSAYSNQIIEKDVMEAILEDCVKSVISKDKDEKNY